MTAQEAMKRLGEVLRTFAAKKVAEAGASECASVEDAAGEAAARVGEPAPPPAAAAAAL